MYLKRKYQVGGIAYTPYLAAQAGSTQETSGSSSSSSSSPEKISGTIKGEIVNLLKENGLPSDVSMFLSAAKRFLSNSTNLSSFSTFGGKTGGDYDLSDLIKIQQLVNDVKYNNNLRNKAVEQLTKEAAGSEVALTNTGYMYVKNSEGNLEKITPKQYAENKDDYAPITNDELLYLREHDNGLAFETGILNDIQNTIGMKTIVDHLRDTIIKFGSDKVGGYTTKNDSVKRGLQDLVSAGPDGFYKFESKEQLRDVQHALNYLYNGLSENAKNLIRAKAAVEGGNPKDPNDISNLLLQALYEHTSRENNVTFDKPATEYDPMQTGKKGAQQDQLTQNDYLQRVGNLRGDRTVVTIAPRAAKISDTASIIAPAFSFGAVIKRDKTPVESMSLKQLMSDGWAFAAGEPNDVTFGNRLVKDWEREAIMFDNSSNLTAVMLPYRIDGGHIVPDFDKLDKFNKLQAIIDETPYISNTELNQEASKLNISINDLNYDPQTNTISLKNTMAFLSVSGYVGEDTLDLSANDKKYMEKVDDDYGEFIEDFYNNMILYGKLRPSKGDKKTGNFSKSDSDEFWRGNIFVPMKNAFNAMNLSSVNEYVTKEQESKFYDRVAARGREVEIQRYLQENDPNYKANTRLGQFNDE